MAEAPKIPPDARRKIVSTFEGGLMSDFAPAKLNNKSYTYALNGRVIFNDNGTLSWQTGNGTKAVLQIKFNYSKDTNYKLIGGCEINNVLIVFFTQNTVTSAKPYTGFSEIGFVTQPQDGNYIYQTAFNDQYDPNGELLRLNTRYQIKANGVFENNQTVSSYWNDDNNEPRQFNVVAGLAANNPEFTSGNYLPIGGASTGNKYPLFYSVHSINRMCDIQWGLIKYQYNISGQKLSGKWQYFYRLVTKNRYATPWSPGSGLIFLSSDSINQEDGTKYQMSASGIQTNKGIQLEINYIDQRYSFLEVAFAYYITETGPPTNAAIFFQGKITGTSMIISDTNNTGLVPINAPEQLAQFYTDILHCKTQTVNENYLHNYNVFLRGILEINTAGVTILPNIRKMLSDQAQTPITAPPLLVNSAQSTTVDINLFGTTKETYLIGVNNTPNKDYLNYKGTQWEHLFKGYFRGQTYPFAIVLFSKKGQAFFAQHIGDFTLPEIYGNQWNNVKLDTNGNPVTTTGNTGSVGDFFLTDSSLTSKQITNDIFSAFQYLINMLGVTVGGIDLTDFLYDENGELQVSGFSIVRADRIPNLVAQGLCLNTVQNVTQETFPGYDKGSFVQPLPSSGNKYFTGENNAIDHGENGISEDIQIGFGYFNLEMPDALINPAIITPIVGATGNNLTNLQMKLVGAVADGFIGGDENGFSIPTLLKNPNPTASPNSFNDYMTKNYIMPLTGDVNSSDQTKTTYGPNSERAGGHYGDTYQINNIWTQLFGQSGTGTTPVYSPTDLDKFSFINFNNLQNFNVDGVGAIGFAYLHQNAILIKAGTGLGVTPVNGFVNASLTMNVPANPSTPNFTENRICYYLVNLITGQTYTLNTSLVASRIYKNIGHFIPINKANIAAATQENGRVVFNNMEVWGGDAFVDFFAYARLLPFYNIDGDAAFDYSFGVSFPCETIYNHTLRQGVTYPSVAVRPGFDDADPGNLSQIWNDGIFINDSDFTEKRLEDFNINQCLNATNEVNSYNVKSVYFVEEDDQPNYETVSNVKISGETYDSFRQFLVNNFQIADSKLGAITDVETLGMNVFVLQQKGWGRIRFNERVLDTTAQANLTVGSGLGFQGHDYKDFEYGCQHQFSVINTGTAIYWVDALKGKNIMYNGQRVLLDDEYGQHDFFETITANYWQIGDTILQDGNENFYDNPCDVGGIAAVFDYNNNSAYWTFTNKKIVVDGVIEQVILQDTIEFSQEATQYKGHWTFAPPIYLNFSGDFLSMNGNELYEHNRGQAGNFYGTFHDSKLTFIVNPGASEEFVFDNMKLDLNPAGMANMVSFTGVTEDDTQIVNFNNANDDRPEYRENFLYYPAMAMNQEARLRGKYLEVTYDIRNNGNLVRLVDHSTFVRKSYT